MVLNHCVIVLELLIGGHIDNRSKLLKMELGQQAPIKSKQKMKQDIMKRACSSCFQQVRLPLHNSCWSSFNAGFDYSMPNSRNGFFDACVTQKFYDRDPSIGILMVYCNENNQIIDDIYGNANSYQCHCMDISGELMTFCIGGPRYFEYNLPLESHHCGRVVILQHLPIIGMCLETVSMCMILLCLDDIMNFPQIQAYAVQLWRMLAIGGILTIKTVTYSKTPTIMAMW